MATCINILILVIIYNTNVQCGKISVTRCDHHKIKFLYMANTYWILSTVLMASKCIFSLNPYNQLLRSTPLLPTFSDEESET